ncbi:uncharacterized protein LOC111054990 [Nilaparvata lugens]|uniref:uncharacterized protein LOC111054990 n=1 Tax=Nilaparvata lugens TaxID=108931 RepID=UPI00193CA32B|nr:uncharacterized protein LOC111054990 [Nilaparvata lugens]
MRRPSQMRPWIMTKFIFVALILIWYCMTKVAALFDHEWIETPNLIGDIIGIFFQMVVYSHYREVIDQEKRGRNVNSSSELA